MVDNYFFMSRKLINFLILFMPLAGIGQMKGSNCNSIKKGKFYFYPSNSQKQFLIIRNYSIQKEINLQTNDTSFWKVSWQSPCMFTLTFLQRSQPISSEELLFFNSHKTVVKVLKITKDYYIFKGGLDAITNSSAVADTLWLKRK